MQVEASGTQISADHIDEILRKTVESKTNDQLWAEMMTDKTVLPTFLIGTSLIPILGIMSSIAFIYSHPSYKTTIAGSAGVLSVLNFASQKGILIKDISVFERLAEVDTVIFDRACLQAKTGILSEEGPQIGESSAAPEAKAVIERLRERNIKSIVMISQDHDAPSQKMAEKLGIDHDIIDSLADYGKEGQTICVITHSSAFASANAQVSISLRGASTEAIDSAQIVLMDQELSQLGLLFDTSHRFQSNMKRTFAVVLIPHAIGFFGSLFLQFSVLPVFILVQLGWFGGMAHAMLPWQLDQDEKQALVGSSSSTEE